MYPEVFLSLGFTAAGSYPIPFVGFTDFSVEVNPGPSLANSFPSIIHKDAFLIFRALCKLSMKGLNEDAGAQQDPIALQNKYVISHVLCILCHHLDSSGFYLWSSFFISCNAPGLRFALEINFCTLLNSTCAYLFSETARHPSPRSPAWACRYLFRY
jgi:hypothetical protein